MIAVIPTTQLDDFRGRLLPGTALVGDLGEVLHDWFAGQDADGSVVVLRPDRVVAAIVPPQHLDEASEALGKLIGGQPASVSKPPSRLLQEA